MLNRLTVSALLKTVILVTSFCVVVGFSLNAWDAWGRLQASFPSLYVFLPNARRFGSIMLNRLTVSALLKTVILVTSFCVVVGFSLNAWDAWGRLQAASRIAVIADASANIFKAMHNLRTDRSTTNRLLNSDAPMDPDIEKYLRNIRDTEMPAMGNALGLLGGLEFAQQQTLVPEFDRVLKTMATLQKEFWEAVAKPKAQRRPELAKEYMAASNAMLETLEKLSGTLAAAVNHQDATIDQLLAIKQIAWLLRNTAGEASLIVSTGLSAEKVAPETRLAYTKYTGGIDAAWGALQLTASGMAVAAGDLERDRRDQDRLFRTVLSQPARPAAGADRGRREAGTERQPVDSGHGRASRCGRHCRRSRPRRRQGSRRAPVRHRPPLARDAARIADRRAGAGLRRPDDRRPPRHQAAAHHARRHAEGRSRRPPRRYRLRRAPRRNRRTGRRAGDLQAAGRRQGPDRDAGARTQCRRHSAAAGDREPCRRVREHGAPDAQPARRRFRPDADHLGRPVDDFAPDQRARAGRREGFQRGLDERRDGGRGFRRAQRLDQRHQPAGGACRRHRQPRGRPGP